MPTDDVEQDIAQTREHLGETVDALAAKLDITSRAQASFAQADKRKLGAIAVVALAAVGTVVLWNRHR